MNLSTVDELKDMLNRICSEKHKILDVLYYPAGQFTTKSGECTRKDTIAVLYVWDCLSCRVETRGFETVEDCLNHFNSRKTRLSDVKASRHSENSVTLLN